MDCGELRGFGKGRMMSKENTADDNYQSLENQSNRLCRWKMGMEGDNDDNGKDVTNLFFYLSLCFSLGECTTIRNERNAGGAATCFFFLAGG